ncbi:endoribonuclease Dicer-like [Styela clava]
MPANVFTPRPYQIELVERALKRNTIACLNSASAKSFVWMTYLREILGESFRPYSSDGRQTNAFVLFYSDYFVREYGLKLRCHLDMSIASITSDKGSQLDSWGWDEIMLQNMIIVTTPEVFSEAITNNMFDIEFASILILDDCHTILSPDSDYRKILQVFDKAGKNPYILGLTCSLLRENGSASVLEKDINEMERLLHCKAETATDLIALDGFSPSQPDEKIVLCAARKPSVEIYNNDDKLKRKKPDKICSEIREILTPAIEWLKICKISSKTVLVKSEETREENCIKEQNVMEENNLEDDDKKTSDTDRNPEISDTSTQPDIDVDNLVNMSLTVLSQVLLVLDILGLWCAHRLVILLLKQLQKNIRNQDSFDKCTDNVNKWKFMLLRHTDSHLRAVYALCQTYMGSQRKSDLKLVSPKVNRLLQVLKEYKPTAEPERKNENPKVSKYNDRSEASYVSWWQDSDAEEDEEEEEQQMMLKNGNERTDGKKEADVKPGMTRSSRQYHHANTLCGIVFVREKYVALMLQRLLKEASKDDSELWHISSAHMTSIATSPTSSTNILEKTDVAQDIYNNATNSEKLKQEEVLRSFRSHEINLLISTNCLEEFADIPKCNLVLRFDVPDTYKSYILSKSRVRSNNSTYMMLVNEEEKNEFMTRLQEYKKIEKVLQDSVYGNQVIKESPPADFDYFDVAEDDPDIEDEDNIPPYYSGPSTCVTMDSAIHVINRYCSRLPSDPFTHLSPRCEVFEVSSKDARNMDSSLFNGTRQQYFECSLQLPINAHVQNPIKGTQMSSVLLAQKAVALEACKVLHKAGELDDHFMPIGKEMVKYAEELDPWPEEKSSVLGRPGTTKRRQTYEKEVPAALSGCLPRPDIPLFLYEIEMKLHTRMPDELNVRRRKLHAPEETTRCFGILSAKPLPPVLGFPIFTRSGEESVRVKLCRSFISLGLHHIKMIRSFHHYLFSDMLRIDRVPLIFKPDLSPTQIYIVILDKKTPTSDLDIDWKFMCEVDSKRRIDDRMRSDPWFRHRLLESKGGKNIFVFKRSKYEDGVVVAKYRSPDQPNRFYVAEIKDDLNPYSSFPSSEYESFHHYYRIKYGLDISCLKQPLLDVDHTSSRLNLLTPRYMNQKGKVLPVTSLEKKRAKYETLTNRQILVPELCDLHPIPASLWRKAVCIPSIVYRLSSILVAEELRHKIYEDSGIGQGSLPLGKQWPDLDFGWSNFPNEKILKESDENPENSIENDNNDGGALATVPEMVSEENDVSLSNAQEYFTLSNTKPSTGDNANNITAKDLETDESEIHDKETEENHESCIVPESETTDNSNSSNLDSNEKSVSIELNLNNKDSDETDSFEFDFEYDSDDYKLVFDIPGQDCKKSKKKIRKKRKDCLPLSDNDSLFKTIPSSIIDELSSQYKSELAGPSPGLILQVLTLSNASDGFNLERLEMLGDSFLKHAVTVYLFCTYPDAHEGKLSYMRSKKVSNYNLYRIGQQRNLPRKMTALIFDPAVNWLPPGYIVGGGIYGPDTGNDDDIYKDSQYDSLDDDMEIGVWTGVPGQKLSPSVDKMPDKKSSSDENTSSTEKQEEILNNNISEDEEEEEVFDEDEIQMIDNMLGGCLVGGMNGLNGSSHSDYRRQNGFPSFTGRFIDRNVILRNEQQNQRNQNGEFVIDTWTPVDAEGKPLCATDPLLIDLHTQHSLADKSIADCVEAILGSYLTTCGHRSAQLLLCYFGLKVLPRLPQDKLSTAAKPSYGYLKQPTNVLLDESPSGLRKLKLFTKDLAAFEQKINYTFKNKGYLLQAFTHASYYLNTITDCYQRLEFLGDAILDFLITRRLYNDPSQRHSPGALTDLRSALVNNTIFASLAVRHDFHKFFKAVSPELHHIIDGFVRYQQQQDDAQGMDAQLAKKYYSEEDNNGSDEGNPVIVSPGDLFGDQDDAEEEEDEDVEVPKALGDIFESVAGAIYMDSGMDLDEVWRVYKPMMNPLIEKFSSCVPRAPVRELLEMEPETAKFSWAEKRCDGKVRVTVEVIGKGSFKGVGRSYRIAKSAAARRALRFLKSQADDV